MKRLKCFDLLQLTAPMIVRSFMIILLGVVDTAFIGRVSITALAAVSVAGAVYSVLTQIITASTSGYQILAARRFGAGEREVVMSGLLHSLMISLPFSFLCCALLWISSPLIDAMTHDPSVVRGALLYLKFLSPSLIALVLLTTVQGTLDTAKQTQWGMYASVIAVVSNVVLDYFLIFGIGPFPQMGIAGAALASTIAIVFSTFFVIIVLVKKQLLPRPHIKFKWDEAQRQFRLSFPEISSAALDYAGNLLFVTIIGFLGSTALAGGRIAFQLLIILFIVSMQFGVGVKILMGHCLGSENLHELLHQFSIGRTTSVLVITALGIPLVLFPETIIHIFTSSTDVTQIAVGAVRTVGFCAPLMAWTTSCAGALRAHGKTTWLMYSNLGAIWFIQLPIAWAGAHFGYNLTGVYAAFIAYFLVRAVISHFLVISIHANTKNL